MSWFIIIPLLLLALAAIGVIGTQFFNLLVRDHPPFVSTKHRLIAPISAEIELRPGDTLYELGAGKAPILRTLAKKYPQANFVGIEYAFFPCYYGRLLNKLSGVKVAMRRENLFEADISKADYIYCYLFNSTMAQLEQKVIAECKPEATIISLNFGFPNLRPYKSIVVSPREKLHFYKVRN